MKAHPSFLARQQRARDIAAAFERDQVAADAPLSRARTEAEDLEDMSAPRERSRSKGKARKGGSLAVVNDLRARAPRVRMLRDIMITAFEGGSNYWAEARNVRRQVGHETAFGGHEGDYISFEVRSFEDRDDARLGRWVLINEAAVERGLRLILDNGLRPVVEKRNPVSVRRDIWAALALANADPEQADIDAEVADCIVQAAAWGEIVYG